MVSRRLIRIKAFQVLFSKFAQNDIQFDSAYSELKKSVQKTQDLYFLLLRLLVDVRDLRAEKIEISKKKLLPTSEDLNPKTKFADNSYIQQLENNLQYLRYQNDNTLNWSEHTDIIEKIYQLLINSKAFDTYVNGKESSYKEDKKIVSFFFEEIVGQSEEIIETLEEISIYWTEDFEFVTNSILKTIRTSKETDSETKLLSELYKNDDDKRFAYDLIKHTLENHNQHIDLIEKYAKNWEIDRIIQVDILLMEMALSELIYMPSIPIKVSLDEYIELSKFYSSAKSKVFINGVLDKLIEEFIKKDKIVKKGRGLIGQV